MSRSTFMCVGWGLGACVQHTGVLKCSWLLCEITTRHCGWRFSSENRLSSARPRPKPARGTEFYKGGRSGKAARGFAAVSFTHLYLSNSGILGIFSTAEEADTVDPWIFCDKFGIVIEKGGSGSDPTPAVIPSVCHEQRLPGVTDVVMFRHVRLD